MKKVLILGAGMMTKTMADYFMDKCNFEVTIASRTVSKAEKIIAGKPLGKAISWTVDQPDVLENLVKENDLVASMIPQIAHDMIAKICLKYKKHMLQTDFLTPYIESIDEEARRNDIIIMNEIGEDPGLDHMGAQETIDEIKAEGGKVVSLYSYGSGIPSFDSNRNPFGYKFSWSPKGLMMSAKKPAAYLLNGKRVDVPSIFHHHKIIDVEGIGTFESYPNRDCTGYVKYFGLEKNVTLFRGLLRYVGYCNTMRALVKLNILKEEKEEKSFKGLTYAQMMANLIHTDSIDNIKAKVGDFLGIVEDDDILERLDWLGLFENKSIPVEKGIYSDVLVELMINKLSYKPGEKDMIIVYDEVIAEFPDRKEKRTSSLMMEGIPNGESAMTRAVSLPAAIAAKLILEGKVTSRGVVMPMTPEIYKPVLEEMKTFGFEFSKKTILLS
ncbi:MAG: saccharopine dehydrogenase NADP-binding domain-containing protein [Bacteroidales bacterium]|nr:saccharopine dehydrogenase NADP-binding domain-containing protein [Bacteroidales bacterium]